MRRTVYAALTMLVLPVAAALAQDAPAPAEAAPGSKPLVAPPPNLSGPAFRRMRGNTGPPPAAADAPKITNYFLHLQQLVAEANAQPLPEPKQPGETATQPREYAFEVIEGLNAKDLMRALREGIREARDANYGKSEEYIDRLSEVNARFVLEYYPLVATDTEAVNNLLYIMEDANAELVVRRLLYRLALPGREHDSLFARYLQRAIVQEADRVYSMYGVAITTPGDDPAVRQLAMENLYAGRLAGLRAFVAQDPNAEAFRAAHGRAPEPIDLRDPAVFAVVESNRTALNKLLVLFSDMAVLFGGILKPTSGADEGLRAATAALLTRMGAEIPFSDPALIAKLLEEAATPPVPTAAPPADAGELAF